MAMSQYKMTDQEKAVDVTNILVGKISYTDLENAKKQYTEAKQKLEKARLEYFKANNEATRLDQIKQECYSTVKQAEEQLEQLINDWRRQDGD